MLLVTDEKVQIIHDGVSVEKSAIKAECIVQYNGYKIRILIKADNYDFQSYGISWVWSKDDLEWKKLRETFYPDLIMNEAKGQRHEPQSVIEEMFQEDIAILFQKSIDILDD